VKKINSSAQLKGVETWSRHPGDAASFACVKLMKRRRRATHEVSECHPDQLMTVEKKNPHRSGDYFTREMTREGGKRNGGSIAVSHIDNLYRLVVFDANSARRARRIAAHATG